MTEQQLKRANELKKEIKELEWFTDRVSKSWRGKVKRIRERIIFSNVPYGVIEEKELECNTKLKNRINDVVMEYKKELEAELEAL